jgi:hypothetical protein
LITDQPGKELLIDTFHLPYTDVRVMLGETLSDFPVVSDGIAKVLSWACLEEPFLFVDESVFLWEKLSCEKLGTDVVILNEATEREAVVMPLFDIQGKWHSLPGYFFGNEYPRRSFSTGVVGARHGKLFHEYASSIKEILKANADVLDPCAFNRSVIDPLIEEYFFAQYVRKKGMSVQALVRHPLNDHQFSPFNLFNSIAADARFSVLPDSLKAEENTTGNLSLMLKALHPGVHAKITGHFERSIQSKPTCHFERTLKALELLSPEIFLAMNGNHSDSAIEFAAMKCIDIGMLQDVFQFENARRELEYKRRETIRYGTNDETLGRFRTIFLESSDELVRARFVLQDSVHIVESEWKWSTYLQEEVLKPLRVVYNIHMPPQYFQTLLSADLLTGRITEYDLPQFDMVLLHVFKNPLTVEEACGQVSGYFEENDDVSVTQLFPLAISRMKELFFMGALRVAE